MDRLGGLLGPSWPVLRPSMPPPQNSWIKVPSRPGPAEQVPPLGRAGGSGQTPPSKSTGPGSRGRGLGGGSISHPDEPQGVGGFCSTTLARLGERHLLAFGCVGSLALAALKKRKNLRWPRWPSSGVALQTRLLGAAIRAETRGARPVGCLRWPAVRATSPAPSCRPVVGRPLREGGVSRGSRPPRGRGWTAGPPRLLASDDRRGRQVHRVRVSCGPCPSRERGWTAEPPPAAGF